MKKETYQYSGYRGRATTTDKLRAVAIALFVLVLLALAALLIGQRYIVYTDDGIRVELPFLEQEETKQPSEELDNIEVVVQPEEEEPVEEPAPSETMWMKAVTLPMEAVLDGTAAEKARQLGANAIVLDMKDEWGKLGYISQLPLAQQIGVNHPDPEINGKLGELSGGEFYLVARISCFRDHALATDAAYAIETNSGYRWVDLEEVRWSSPSNPAVNEYLTGIMTELALLGFDEILLERWGYPTEQDGHLEYIKKGENYRVGELDQPIQSFLQQARTALEDSGSLLAVQGNDYLLADDGLKSGQSLKLAAENAQRIWLEQDADAAVAAAQLAQAGAEKPLELLVPAAEELASEQDGHQWLLNEEM